jgi:hypothetical protein
MGTPEVGDHSGSEVTAPNAANFDASPAGLAETPVIDRIPKLTSNAGTRRRRPPRPTLEKPRTTLLLPRTRGGWLKAAASTVGALSLVVGALFGVRYVTATGCEEFGLDRQTVWSRTDGFAINVKPEALTGSFGVKLGSIPLSTFMSGSAPDAAAARSALPPALTPRSNFVKVETCRVSPRAMTLRMAAPAGEAELNKLDLYGWDGNSRVWTWLGGEVDPGTREIVGRVGGNVPAAVMLVKTSATRPVLGVEIAPRASNSGGANAALPSTIGEVSAYGLYLGDNGAITGDRLRLQAPPGARVVPVVRNWSDKGEVNRRLLRDMLATRSSRDVHALNLVTLSEAGNYPGIEIDYRGVDLKQREAFTAFVTELATQLRAKGKTLTVAIPAPFNVSGRWDEGGYDVNALGRLSNYAKLDLSTNPGALTSDQLPSLLNWAAGQINRYKLQLVLPSLSVRQDAYNRTRLVDIREALAPLGGLAPEQDVVPPGASVRLNWRGRISGMRFDEGSQTYRFNYVDARGIQQTTWINTAASFKRSLERVAGFNVRGITLRGLESVDNTDYINQIVADFAEQRLANAQLPTPELSVAVAGAVATVRLDSPIVVQAPAEPGDYPVIPAFKSVQAIDVNASPLRVSKDAPPVVPTATPKVNTAHPGMTFELGGNARGFDHVAQMKSSGMTWIRISISGFEIPSEFIQQAKVAGLKVMVEATGDRARVLDAGYQDQFAQHLGKLAAAGVDAIEVWDEPNYEATWPSGQIHGGTYTDLLKKAYTAIKAANSRTLVVSGGLVASEVFGGGCSQNGCDDMMFLSQMAAAGAQNYMDCVGAHYLSGFSAPGATGGTSAYNYRSLYYAPMRDLYHQAFGGSKPVCFTELGFVSPEGFNGGLPRAFSFASATTAAQQAQWLAESAQLSLESGKVRMMLVWNIDSQLWVPGESGDPQAGYAMIRPDGTCPSCEALRTVMTAR